MSTSRWRLPAEPPPPNLFNTVEEFYNFEVVGSQAEEMPRVAAVEPLRHRDFDVEVMIHTPLPLLRSRPFE